MKRINLKKKKHLRMQVLFLAPRTGLEPVTSQSAVMLPFAVPGKRRAYAAPFLRPLHFVDLPFSATGSGRFPHHRLSYRGILLYRCLYGLSEAV